MFNDDEINNNNNILIKCFQTGNTSLPDSKCLWNKQMQIELAFEWCFADRWVDKGGSVDRIEDVSQPWPPRHGFLYTEVTSLFIPPAPPRPLHPTIVPGFMTSCLKRLWSILSQALTPVFSLLYYKDQELNSPYKPYLSVSNVTCLQSSVHTNVNAEVLHFKFHQHFWGVYWNE